MNIKPIESNDVEDSQYQGDVVYYNYDTDDYDHYNSNLLSSQDLTRLKAYYQRQEDIEDIRGDTDGINKYNYINSISDEYYEDLAEEFADEFANYQPTNKGV